MSGKGPVVKNKSCIFLARREESVAGWKGRCLRLAQEVAERHRAGSILVVVPTDGLGLPIPQTVGGGWWAFHAAPVVAGLVHDAWFPALVLPPVDYCAQAFPVPDVQLHHAEDLFDAWDITKRANDRALQLWEARGFQSKQVSA